MILIYPIIFSYIDPVVCFILAFRMESIFRLLLHEQSLVQVEHPDPKLLLSLDYHRRDLATTLETAKWQVFINVDLHVLCMCVCVCVCDGSDKLFDSLLLFILYWLLSLISWKILKEQSTCHQ